MKLAERDDQIRPNQSVIVFSDIKGSNIVAVLGSAFANSALATQFLAERSRLPS